MVAKNTVAKNSEPQIGQMQAALQALREEQRSRKEKIEALEAEQRIHLVAARVHKKPAAQGEVERLQGEIANLRTDHALGDLTIAELAADLGAAKTAQRRQYWQEQCAPVREILQARATGDLEQEALEITLKLQEKLVEIDTSDRKIIDALRLVHGLLAPSADEVQRLRNQRPDIILCCLKALPNPFNGLYAERLVKDPRSPAVTVFQQVLAKLEEIAQTEPEAELPKQD